LRRKGEKFQQTGKKKRRGLLSKNGILKFAYTDEK